MRKNRLCPSPDHCPEALTLEVQANPQSAVPCEECPLEKLHLYLASQRGQAMSMVVDLDFALQNRLQVPLDRINYWEFCLLRLLAEERNRFQIEEIEKSAKARR
jgi:hypothetical protein